MDSTVAQRENPLDEERMRLLRVSRGYRRRAPQLERDRWTVVSWLFGTSRLYMHFQPLSQNDPPHSIDAGKTAAPQLSFEDADRGLESRFPLEPERAQVVTPPTRSAAPPA